MVVFNVVIPAKAGIQYQYFRQQADLLWHENISGFPIRSGMTIREEMARPRVSRGWHEVYHARGVVAPYVGPQLAEAIGIGNQSAVRFLGNLKNQFIHAVTIIHWIIRKKKKF